MIRETLDVHKFKRSGEVPPLDDEDYIMWKFQRRLLTNDEAVLALAEYRRDKAREDRWKKRVGATKPKIPVKIVPPTAAE